MLSFSPSRQLPNVPEQHVLATWCRGGKGIHKDFQLRSLPAMPYLSRRKRHGLIDIARRFAVFVGNRKLQAERLREISSKNTTQ